MTAIKLNTHVHVLVLKSGARVALLLLAHDVPLVIVLHGMNAEAPDAEGRGNLVNDPYHVIKVQIGNVHQVHHQQSPFA